MISCLTVLIPSMPSHDDGLHSSKCDPKGKPTATVATSWSCFYRVFVVAARKTPQKDASGRGQSAETEKMRRGQVWKGGPGLCLFNPRGWGSAPVNSRQMPSSVEQAGAVEIGTRLRI